MKNNNFKLTVKMLAKICNVSEGTVDRAIHNRRGIKNETREKILNVARRHGYIEGAEKNKNLIGVVVFDLYNSYFSEFLMAFENECKKVGFSMVVMFTDKDCETEYMCIKQLYCMGVKSIVLCPCNEGKDFEDFLKSIDMNVITTGNRLNGFTYVGTDNFRAMYDAAKMMKNKSKKILYYSPALKSQINKSAQQERYEGFMKCVNSNGIKHKVVISATELQEVLDNDSDWSVLCSTDYYKSQVLSLYPHCMVMGFDGLEKLKNKMNVDTNVTGIAEKCMKVLMNNEERDVIVPYTVNN